MSQRKQPNEQQELTDKLNKQQCDFPRSAVDCEKTGNKQRRSDTDVVNSPWKVWVQPRQSNHAKDEGECARMAKYTVDCRESVKWKARDADTHNRRNDEQCMENPNAWIVANAE